MFAGRRDRLIFACSGVLLNFAKLLKAKSVEFIRVCVDSFICMSGAGRDGDNRARGNRHAVGKCERAQRKTVGWNWEEAESRSVSRIWGVEEGIQRTGDEAKP